MISQQSIVRLVMISVLMVGCKSSRQIPDPELFDPAEDTGKVDLRSIVFHNNSVEVAALEIFAPSGPIKDCQAEAPHRLLCPKEYRQILAERVYSRSKTKTTYPPELPQTCPQVWVRVQSKAMSPNTYREGVFVLPTDGNQPLELTLTDDKPTQLEQRKLDDQHNYPPPARFCDPAQPEQSVAPAETARTRAQVEAALAPRHEQIRSCCNASRCRGKYRFELALRRDGTVFQTRSLTPSSGKNGSAALMECLVQVLNQARFPGFTPSQTSAEVALTLPLRR